MNSQLRFGNTAHSNYYERIGIILDELKHDGIFLEEDLLCRTEEGDAYLCFLSDSRKRERPPLEKIASHVEKEVNKALHSEFSEIVRDSSPVAVGFSRILYNSMIRAERLVSSVVNESRASAALQIRRLSERNKALLQDVILGETLTPVYQPIVDLGTGQISGYESLVRGPKGSALESPGTLFQIADDVGLTFELDRACFRACLRGAAGLEPIHRLFVNLLPWSFYDANFIENEVSHLLNAANLTPANVVFEITEKLAIENFESFRSELSRFTAMGFGVAVDDVGTKHSNLESVMSLRPNLIKISDVVTTGLARSAVKREMMSSLCRIAAAIDAVVVAEGIETPDDLVVLHDLGVRYGQGFFLARPGPPFPELRSSVQLAISALSQQNVKDRAHDSDFPLDMDEHGEIRDPSRPGTGVREAVRELRKISNSASFDNIDVSMYDDFDEKTRDRRDTDIFFSKLREHPELIHGDLGKSPTQLPEIETPTSRKIVKEINPESGVTEEKSFISTTSKPDS